jgi:CheY-like chemotaxis protein
MDTGINNFKNFLIIDDDKSNNLLCKMILKKVLGDVDITVYDNPRAGLDYILSEYGSTEVNRPAVLFLDINMPDISGWELLDIYKNFDAHIHNQFTIYMLSSSVDAKDKSMAEQNPLVTGFISKPLTRDIIGSLFFKEK